MAAFGGDFYAANLHKWMFAPAAAAFLHCGDPSLRRRLHHPITSHLFHDDDNGDDDGTAAGPKDPPKDGLFGGFLGECRMLGTRDYGAILSVPVAIDFWDRLDNDVQGGDPAAALAAGEAGEVKAGSGLLERNRSLVLAAARDLSGAWGTAVGQPAAMIGSTVMVSRARRMYTA